MNATKQVSYLTLGADETDTAQAADQQWVEVDLQTVLEATALSFFTEPLYASDTPEQDYTPALVKSFLEAALEWQWGDLGNRIPQMRILVRFDKETSHA